MKTLKTLVPFVILMLGCNFLNAQEMKPEKHENLQWYYISLIKYEDGKMEDAQKIIDNYFIPTDQASGLQGPVMGLEVLFSDWDQLVIFPMEEGIQALEWKMSPRDVKWMTAFNERAGGEEKGKEIMAEFESYVKDYKNMLARSTRTPTP